MKKLRVLLLCIVAAGMVLSSCNDGGKGKEIYLQLYSVRDQINQDYNGTIAKVAEAGYTGVEAANYSDGKFYGMTPEEFRKTIEDAGMEVLSSHVGRSLSDSIPATDWDEVWNWWDATIQAHKDAGMKYIVTPSMPIPKTLADLQVYCDYYNQIGEKCNAAGIRFGYHNHSFEYVEIEGEIMYDYMLKNTDPDKVFFQMDVYWTTMAGKNPVDYFNEYPGRFEVLHIKDEKELGRSGKMDFESIFNNLDVAGTKKLVVEIEAFTEDAYTGIKESCDFLNNAPYVKSRY